MNKKIIAIAIFIFVLTSCGEKKNISKITLDNCPIVANKIYHNNSEITVCDLSLIKDTINIPITSILSSFEVVRLESSEEALTSSDSYIAISENYIGIYSSSNGYKLYNIKGEFTCCISSRGQGPDEYALGLCDSYIDEKYDRIYLIPYMASKILVFDLMGNALEHIPLFCTAHKARIKIDTSKQEVLVMALPFKDTPYAIWKQDFQGNLLQAIDATPFVIIPEDYGNSVGCSWNNNHLDYHLSSYMPTIQDSLYHYNIEDNLLTPVFTVTFKDDISWHMYLELPKHYIMRLITPTTPFNTPRSPQILIDKNTLQGCFVNWKIDPLGNINGPNWIDFRDEYFTANMFPHELKEQLESIMSKSNFINLPQNVKNRVIELNNSITENDNNIIIYGKLKNFE